VTFSKAIDRLIAFGPPLLVANTKLPNHCVLATAVAVDVLALLGEEVYPLAVRVVLLNRRAVAALTAKPDDRGALAVAVATGAHLLDTGPDGGVSGAAWSGHLLAWMPDRARVLDLNHGAFNRPTHRISVPAAVSLPFHFPDAVYRTDDGCRLELRARPDDRQYLTAPDWDPAKRAPIVATLYRAVRSGKLA
jgi:hypothetical protein